MDIGRRREDAETIGGIYAFDCSALCSRSPDVSFSRSALSASLKRIHTSDFDRILLYGLAGFSAEKVMEISSVALSAGFSGVRIEITADSLSAPGMTKELLESGVEELHVIFTASFNDDREVIRVFKGIMYEASDIGKAHSIRAKILLPQNDSSSEKILRELAAIGVGYIIATADLSKKPRTNSEKLRSICEHVSDKMDITIELRQGESSFLSRGKSWRRHEAEELLLDIPYCEIWGRKIPLGAVFQLGFKCSQKCLFCTSDKSLPEPGDEYVRGRLSEVLDMKNPRVVFTGGEPTLNRSLCDYIATCRGRGTSEISLYTNGMALSATKYTKGLSDAGLDLCLVSLHSASAAVSDRITRCPGGFKKTARGIENILNEGILTIINFVVNAINYMETPAFASFISKHFTGASLNLSYVAPVTEDSASSEIVPRFSDAAPFIIETLDVCGELGITVTGLEPHWGMPPCAIGFDKRYFPFFYPLVEKFSGFVKASACSGCVLDKSCPGIRKHYARLYGTDELTPMKMDNRRD